MKKPKQEMDFSDGDFINKEFVADFYADARVLAKQYMESFFSDKMLHCGGRIPHSLLFAERRVSMVLNYNIAKAVDRAYKYLEKELSEEEIEESKITGEVTRDIELVVSILEMLSKSNIPQQFAGGMLCLYLEFVEGIYIGTEA